MKEKLNLFILILSLLIILIAGLFINFHSYKPENYREFDYAWTKALCEGNSCRDYLITCDNGEVTEIIPITGFVTFPDNWQDPRDEDFRNKLC